MKATDLLKKQHKSVKARFRKVEETEDGRRRRQLMDEIANELKIHTKIEEEIDESLEEHHVVDLVLAELVEHHADEEEDEMFPMSEKKLGKERLQELGEQMQRMAESAQRRAA